MQLASKGYFLHQAGSALGGPPLVATFTMILSPCFVSKGVMKTKNMS